MVSSLKTAFQAAYVGLKYNNLALEGPIKREPWDVIKANTLA
jgi:hypothetical protein